MKIYTTDDGHLMERSDFVPYVLWLIGQNKAENKHWEPILAAEFWGDQLLVTQILNEIKELIK